MKVVILAGGLGTRISEESHLKPKPMIEIGDKPILWHIMKGYAKFGYYEFIICCGYKQHIIKDWFADYFLYNSDVTFDFSQNNKMIIHNNVSEPWKVTVVDTGLHTMTGGRIKRIESFVKNESFMVTYGDGVADINLKKLEKFHRDHDKIATISAYKVTQRFGVLNLDCDNNISSFHEKSHSDSSKINIGYMVFNPEIFNYLESDSCILEKHVLEKLAEDNQLKAFIHEGFWKCMDTQREKSELEKLWETGNAPWKVW